MHFRDVLNFPLEEFAASVLRAPMKVPVTP